MRGANLLVIALLSPQYTALVDAHVPRLAACLGDRHELVRRQALALLANLLQKARGCQARLARCCRKGITFWAEGLNK